MKNRWRSFILLFLSVLSISACFRSKEDAEVLSGDFEVNQELYLACGSKIYIGIESDGLDYKKINAEICAGNAGKVKEEYENKTGNPKNSEIYVVTQNLLGIAEAYLGDYQSSYERFIDLIDLTEKSDWGKKEEILMVLYNNIGVVKTNLKNLKIKEDWLKKAEELCGDPYTYWAIQVNRVQNIDGNMTKKQLGIMIAEMKEIVERSEELDISPDFVLYIAALNMADGFIATEQEERAIKLLDKYMPQIPEEPEYYLIKAAYLGKRGYANYQLQEYGLAIEDEKAAAFLAQNTVDGKSQELMILYKRLAESYQEAGDDHEIILSYLQKAIPGYRYMPWREKGDLYYETGVEYEELGERDQSKICFLKSYIYYSFYKPEIPVDVDHYTLYGNTYFPEQWLHEIYDMEEDGSMDFREWLLKEVKMMNVKEDDWP